MKDFTGEELKDLYEMLGIGAMKFYVLRVDPKKRMIFNPEESIDFHGYTGPLLQYTYARIQSILRKVSEGNLAFTSTLPATDPSSDRCISTFSQTTSLSFVRKAIDN